MTTIVDPVNELAVDGPAEPVPSPQRPDHIPEKFWDGAAGIVRTDTLAKSYVELERKLGRMVAVPEVGDSSGWDRLLELLGRPATPDGYKIASPHPLVEVDPDLNAKLHGAGFTQKQAQMVYELAAEQLIPMMKAGLDDVEAERQVDRLQHHFGGAGSWRETARQIKTWADATLPGEVLSALAGTYEGVLALHQMMQATEPNLTGASEPSASAVSALDEMVRDPRYWRDRDPDFVARVSSAFARLYPG